MVDSSSTGRSAGDGGSERQPASHHARHRLGGRFRPLIAQKKQGPDVVDWGLRGHLQRRRGQRRNGSTPETAGPTRREGPGFCVGSRYDGGAWRHGRREGAQSPPQLRREQVRRSRERLGRMEAAPCRRLHPKCRPPPGPSPCVTSEPVRPRPSHEQCRRTDSLSHAVGMYRLASIDNRRFGVPSSGIDRIRPSTTACRTEAGGPLPSAVVPFQRGGVRLVAHQHDRKGNQWTFGVDLRSRLRSSYVDSDVAARTSSIPSTVEASGTTLRKVTTALAREPEAMLPTPALTCRPLLGSPLRTVGRLS